MKKMMISGLLLVSSVCFAGQGRTESKCPGDLSRVIPVCLISQNFIDQRLPKLLAATPERVAQYEQAQDKALWRRQTTIRVIKDAWVEILAPIKNLPVEYEQLSYDQKIYKNTAITCGALASLFLGLKKQLYPDSYSYVPTVAITGLYTMSALSFIKSFRAGRILHQNKVFSTPWSKEEIEFMDNFPDFTIDPEKYPVMKLQIQVWSLAQKVNQVVR